MYGIYVIGVLLHDRVYQLNGKSMEEKEEGGGFFS